jgi:septal ring factor EnvC (AmiA/AmiB activator)
MTDVRKLIGKCTQNVEAFNENSRALLKELYSVAAVEFVTADHRKEFESLKAEIETAKQDLAGVKAQIDAGKAELQRLATERKSIEQEIKKLDAERRSHINTLDQVKKRLADAEAA